MRTIKLILTPEIQLFILKAIGAIILMVAILILLNKYVIIPSKNYFEGYRNCINKSDDLNWRINETQDILTNCTAQKAEQLNNLNTNITYWKGKYDNCISVSSSKNSQLNELTGEINDLEIELNTCKTMRDSYKQQHDTCENNLEECEGI